MIKATISNKTKRDAFASLGAKSIARGECTTNNVIKGLVLDGYEVLASGMCSDLKIKNKELDNVIIFTKQKEVA